MAYPDHPQHDRADKPDRPRQDRQDRDRQDKPYRIERSAPARSNLLPESSMQEFYRDRGLAVAVAVKSLSDPTRHQVRVVHVPSGEVVFESEAPQRPQKLQKPQKPQKLQKSQKPQW